MRCFNSDPVQCSLQRWMRYLPVLSARYERALQPHSMSTGGAEAGLPCSVWCDTEQANCYALPITYLLLVTAGLAQPWYRYQDDQDRSQLKYFQATRSG